MRNASNREKVVGGTSCSGLASRDNFSLLQLAENIPSLSDELSKLPSHTEAAFLCIGANLQIYHEKATRIADLSASATSTLVGDELKRTVDAVAELLEYMTSYIKAAEAGTEQRIGRFYALLESIGEIEVHMNEFARLSKSLRVLGVTTKIYAPDNGGGSYNTALAGDISVLSEDIGLKAVRSLADLKTVAASLKDATRHIRDIKDIKYRQLYETLGKMSSGLKKLKKRHDFSFGNINQLSQLSKAISRDVEKVIVAAQYQDITQQKFQHARQALDSLSEVLYAEGNAGYDGCCMGPENLLETTATICERVLVNMLDARSAFIDAVEDIVDSLGDIASIVGTLSDHMHDMAQSNNKTGRTFLEEMEENLTSAGGALSAIFEAEIEVANAVAEAGNTVLKISSLIGEIEEIGDNVDIIAMNAAVRAAQSNSKGSVMGVLAREIRKVSGESILTTSEATVSMKKFSKGVTGLLTAVNDEIKATQDAAFGIEQEMSYLLGTLGDMNRRVAVTLEDMDAEAQELSESIKKVVKSTNSHHHVDKVVGFVVSRLSVIANIGFRPPMGDSRGVEGGFVETGQRDFITPGNGVSSEFGSNIELFE